MKKTFEFTVYADKSHAVTLEFADDATPEQIEREAYEELEEWAAQRTETSLRALPD